MPRSISAPVLLPSFSFLLSFLLTFPFTRCNQQNVTCDDQLGCDLPGDVQEATIEYIPDDGWQQGAVCSVCKIHADPNRVSNGTWHDTTLNKGVHEQRAINITFQGKQSRTTHCPIWHRRRLNHTMSLFVFILLGIAIYAFFVMPDDVSSFDHGITLLSNMSVYLDDVYAGEIVHVPQDGAQLLYNFPGYSVSGLSNDIHLLSMSVNNQVASSVVEFDYFIFTSISSSGEPTEPSLSGSAAIIATRKSVVGPALGGALGGLSFFVIFGSVFVTCKRRQGTSWIRRASANW